MGQRFVISQQTLEGTSDYFPPFGFINYSTGQGDDSDKSKAPISLYGIITQVYVSLCSSDGTPTGPGEGESYNIYLNGTSESQIVTIEDTDTNGTSRAMSIVEPGDVIYFRITRTSVTPTLLVRISVVLWTPSVDESHISGNFLTSSVATVYSGMGRSSENMLAAQGGTLSHLYVRLEDAPGSGKSRTFTIMKNDVATSLEVTISNTDEDGSDTVNSVEFSANDEFRLRSTQSGSPSGCDAGYSVKMTGVDNRFLVAGGYTGVPNYHDLGSVVGSLGDPSTLNPHKSACHELTLKNMYAILETAPGAGETATLTIVKETNSSESDTALTIEFTEGETEKNITQDVAITKGDTVHVRRDRTGGYSIELDFWVGLTCEAAPTTPTVATTKIVKSTAYGNVTVIGDGSTCSVRGFCYKEATSGDPNVFDDSVVLDGSIDDGEFAIGEYIADLSLEAGKLYRFRAFAINDTALAYGTTAAAYFAAPADAMARVSAIRRIFRPGVYRMELALGDLGFEWDVAEAAMKKTDEGVEEPEKPEEPPKPELKYPPDEVFVPDWMKPEVSTWDRYRALLEGTKDEQFVSLRPITDTRPSVPAQAGGTLVDVARGVGTFISYVTHPGALVTDMIKKLIGWLK